MVEPLERGSAAGALRARGLRFGYGPSGAGGENLEALAGVDFDLQPGELVFVVGPNGAGKSTLLQLLCGCLLPVAGEVQVGGERLEALGALETARRIAVVPQALDGVSDVRVRDFVLGGRYAHIPRFRGAGPADLEAVQQALERTATGTFAERTMGQLSGGQRQRVLLARALAQGARMLLLDEPTASLDPRYQAETLELVRGLAGEGYGVALVTHDLAWAGTIATRIVVLHQGRVAAAGTPAEVLRPEALEPVYGPHLWFGQAPDGGGPLVIPWTRRQGGGTGSRA